MGRGGRSHLDAEGQAVDAGRPEAREACGVSGAGVGLQRHLGSSGKISDLRSRLQHGGDGTRGGQAGGAPTEEDGGDAAGRVGRLQAAAEGPRAPPGPKAGTHFRTWPRRSSVCASRTRQARTAASSTAGTTYLLKLQ